MGKINLLVVTPILPPQIGGPTTYISGLIENLPKNIRVNIVSFSKPEPFFLKRQWQLFKDIYKHLIWADMCYVQGTLTVGIASMVACRFRGKPYLIKYVGDEGWESYWNKGGELILEEYLSHPNISFIHQLHYYLTKLLLSRAKKVIVPSKYLAGLLKQFYKVNAVEIPNAVKINQVKQVRKQPKRIVTAGRLVGWKHVDQVIQAMKFLADKSDQWQLWIIGDGPKKNNLKQLAGDLKLGKSVKFLGRLSKKNSVRKIAQAEYLVLYSSYEGLPHVILEAMACKTKILASDIMPNREVLEDGKLGRLVKLNQPELLAQTLQTPYTLKMLSEAYKKAKLNYSWDNHIKKLIQYLQ